ncbi:MAG: FAD-dependent oxidoreductase [Betaproteobacteria bacterium]|nr:FAD-dependent oxidoreductase [Betaproteobacteria bacterium]
MPTYQVKLSGREQVAEGTMAFRFEKPAGFSFKPGQAVAFELIDPPAGDGQSRRTFSLVSAPFESTLVVATRMRDSAFKRTLKALPTGGAIKIQGPFGDMTLHEDRARPAAFIAGGIGITPFMSMVRQATKDARPQRLSLIYSNRRPEDAAFLAELQGLERQNPDFRLCATMTEMSQSARRWDGEQGVVDAALVRRCVGDIAAPVYYLAGPPAMVDAMQEVLRGAGVAEDDVHSEEFYGY